MKANGIEYVQLAHNEWVNGRSRPRVVHGFGRKDQLDEKALRRLVDSILRYLEPEEAQAVREEHGLEPPFTFLGAKDLGGPHVLDGMWRRLGVQQVVSRLLRERGYRTPVERVLFASVAQRALAPASKLALESWVANRAYIEGLPEVEVQQVYRSMDFLLDAHDEIQREVFWRVRNLFNLEVDVIFVDTTSVYFEIDGEDEEDEEEQGEDGEDGEALRKRGYSKDARPDLAQAVVAFAVTRDGIPVRCWVWPGNASDVSLIDEVKRDLNEWKLGRVIVVADTGFNSAQNRKTLQGAADAYILGEKLRLGSDGHLPDALRQPGRYKTLENGLKIKDVTLNRGTAGERRFVIVVNPERAHHDRATRDAIVQETERRLVGLTQLAGEAHTKAACDLRAHKTFGRYVRQTKTGKLELDKGKIQREARLDGTFLVSTSDPHLPAEDVVMGYKHLQHVERVHRDLKHTIDVRPVYHHRSDRIRAHMILCWLALLLIRITENQTGETWHQLKEVLDPWQVGRHQTQHGILQQTTKPTPEQKSVLDALELKPPKRYLDVPRPTKA